MNLTKPTTVVLSAALTVTTLCSSALAVASRSGKTYSYRDDAVSAVSMSAYVTDTNAVYRGAMMEADAGQEQKFCTHYGWIMIAISINASGIPGQHMYDTYAVAVMRGLDAWAALDNGKHPEFSHFPIITMGCSNGGSMAYGLAMYAWQRCLAFVCNVGGGYNPANPTDSMIRVPGMFTVGEVDHNVGQYNPDLDTLIKHVRPRGALWSHAYIWGMAHEKRRVMHMFAPFFEKLIPFAYPDSLDPSKGPVHLRRPAESSGWLADPTTWRSGFTVINSYANYTGAKSSAEWLLDQDIAWLYRGYSSTDVRIALHTRDTFPNNDFTSWWQFNLSKPGDQVGLIVDTSGLPGWTKIELYRGCTLVDSIKRGDALGDTMKFVVTAPETPMMLAYNLMGYDNTSRKYPSILYTVMSYAVPTTAVRSPVPASRQTALATSSQLRSNPLPALNLLGRRTASQGRSCDVLPAHRAIRSAGAAAQILVEQPGR
jgi:hypothetical protein